MIAQVKVTLMRRHGKRVKQSIAENEQQYLGTIGSSYLHLTHRVTMSTGQKSDDKLRLPPDLLQPIFSSIRPSRVRLMGYEERGDAVFAQEWVIDFL